MKGIGVIADDFTGATDIAGNLSRRGYRTSVLFGVPSTEQNADLSDTDALVIALKTRTARTESAVQQSVAAFDWLHRAGCEQYFFKYCSTFDSTPTGNIGPVIDALMARLDVNITVAVPTFPETGRTVYLGNLFVGRQRLDESSMRNHPLTPMRDANLIRLLTPQTENHVDLVEFSTVRRGADAVREALADLTARNSRTIAIVDAIDESDLVAISEATQAMPLRTGSSGLALGFPAVRDAGATPVSPIPGHRLIVCGSASEQTRRQVAWAKNSIPARKLSLPALRENADAEIISLAAWAIMHWRQDAEQPVLIYAVDSLADLTPHTGETGTTREADADLIERTLAAVADVAQKHGMRQLIVAGGETSGRVVSQLGIARLDMGQEIAPGVSWADATTAAGTSINIALKSGNFAAEDFFTASWEALYV